MSCKLQHEEFEHYDLPILLLGLITLLKTKVDQNFYDVVETGYHQMLSESIKQVMDCVQREPFTHSDVLEVHRKLWLVKEPLLQLRFEVTGTEENTKLVLTVFALHELFNTISKLVDTLHSLAHVDDKLNLDDLDFKQAVSKHLQELFTNQNQ